MAYYFILIQEKFHQSQKETETSTKESIRMKSTIDSLEKEKNKFEIETQRSRTLEIKLIENKLNDLKSEYTTYQATSKNQEKNYIHEISLLKKEKNRSMDLNHTLKTDNNMLTQQVNALQVTNVKLKENKTIATTTLHHLNIEKEHLLNESIEQKKSTENQIEIFQTTNEKLQHTIYNLENQVTKMKANVKTTELAAKDNMNRTIESHGVELSRITTDYENKTRLCSTELNHTVQLYNKEKQQCEHLKMENQKGTIKIEFLK